MNRSRTVWPHHPNSTLTQPSVPEAGHASLVDEVSPQLLPYLLHSDVELPPQRGRLGGCGGSEADSVVAQTQLWRAGFARPYMPLAGSGSTGSHRKSIHPPSTCSVPSKLSAPCWPTLFLIVKLYRTSFSILLPP